VSLKSRLWFGYVQPAIKQALGNSGSFLQHAATLFPHQVNRSTYTLPAYPEAQARHPHSDLPLPPEPLWAQYCTSAESYLRSGQEDIATLRRLLLQSGVAIEDLGRLLELGVAGGRMIRHLGDLAPRQEIWGVDVWASAVLWCKEHLSPPFHFATTTVLPHVPFEDRSFGLVFAGSVWTHIDDLAEAWALEVRRILRPGGRFYFSVNDRAAVKFFQGGGTEQNRRRYIERIKPENWNAWLAMLEKSPEYQRFVRGEVQMVTMGRSTQAQVLWDIDYLLKRFGPGWRVSSITPEAYGHQTGVLLERL
jgi:SAM-dependent methyltransferase